MTNNKTELQNFIALLKIIDYLNGYNLLFINNTFNNFSPNLIKYVFLDQQRENLVLVIFK